MLTEFLLESQRDKRERGFCSHEITSIIRFQERFSTFRVTRKRERDLAAERFDRVVGESV
jgi:hypothetical protein